MTDLSIALWTRTSSRRKRLLSIAAAFVVAVAVTVLGSLTPISQQDAEQINNDLNQTTTTLSAQGALTQFIFGNNLFICLVMFIPLVGPVVGLYIMFNTGTVVGAIATSGGYPPALAFIALVITPVFWLEFAAYSIAMAESIWLFRRSMQRRFLSELRRNTTLFIAIATVILAVSAFIETALISLVA
jgi:uncharacterized membrane protein SpoIIM required for sporulation